NFRSNGFEELPYPWIKRSLSADLCNGMPVTPPFGEGVSNGLPKAVPPASLNEVGKAARTDCYLSNRVTDDGTILHACSSVHVMPKDLRIGPIPQGRNGGIA